MIGQTTTLLHMWLNITGDVTWSLIFPIMIIFTSAHFTISMIFYRVHTLPVDQNFMTFAWLLKTLFPIFKDLINPLEVPEVGDRRI